MGDGMIYVCGKCGFLFSRKNEPSKCPSCENQCVMTANKDQRQAYIELHGKLNETENHLTDVTSESIKPQ